MLSKEEYLTHLDYGIKTCPSIYDAFKELIDEHFKLVEKHENLKEKCKELSNSNDILRRQLYFIEPYKFEDLKADMWVYDIKYDEFCRIDFIAGIYPHRSYSDGTCEDGVFEENRFYPVQMANNYNDKEKK